MQTIEQETVKLREEIINLCNETEMPAWLIPYVLDSVKSRYTDALYSMICKEVEVNGEDT